MPYIQPQHSLVPTSDITHSELHGNQNFKYF